MKKNCTRCGQEEEDWTRQMRKKEDTGYKVEEGDVTRD
jgi:hypothetical protein